MIVDGLHLVVTEQEIWNQNMNGLTELSSRSVGTYFVAGLGHRLSFPKFAVFDLNFSWQTSGYCLQL